MRVVGGVIQVFVDGVRYDAKGDFTYRLSVDVNETVVGVDSVHGRKTVPTAGYIEGSITDAPDLDLAALQRLSSGVVSLQLANGKQIVGNDMHFIGEVLDVTGHLGGFNFQWAWSSGYCCGQYV